MRVVVVAAKASESQRCPGEVSGQPAFRHVRFTSIYTTGLQVPDPVVSGTVLKRVAEAPTTVLYIRYTASS